MNTYRICISCPRGDKWLTLRAISETAARAILYVNGRKGQYLKQIILWREGI
jgi:hypothetical protein